MKLLMLCREPRLYSCERLKDAALQSGHEMDILDPNRFLLKLSQNAPHFSLFYQRASDEPPQPVAAYDAVLPRFGAASTRMGCALLSYFEGRNIPCLNRAQPFARARDKWQSLFLLREAGLPVPDSVLAGDEFAAKATANSLSSPLILKTLSGSQGIGVILAEQAQSAVSMLDTLRQAQVPTLLQQFIPEAQGRDLRCFVVGNQVVAAMERVSQQDDFRANFHRGGSANPVRLSAEEKQIALRAAQTLGLEVAGVDLIRSAQGALVLEVNASPALEMIEKTSGIDVASQMIAHIEKMHKGA